MGEMVQSVDPRTAEAGPTYSATSPAEVRTAVAAAAEAFRSPAWRDDARRVAFLRRAAAALRDADADIVARAESETGLPEGRLVGELERTCRQLEAFADLVEAGDYVEAMIDPADPDAKPIPRPDVRRMLIPIGPVAVFGASNFPLAFGVAGGDTASAIAAGCPVVAKGHPSHPGTSEAVAAALRRARSEAGLPAGAFALVQGAANEVGEALVDAPEIAAVGFTGSLAAGRALYERAARRPEPIPVYAEMGSVNPVVVTPGALAECADDIAELLAGSVSFAAGQLCTKPGVVLVPEGDAGEGFADALVRRLDDAGPQVMLNERLRASLVARIADVAGDASVQHVGPPGGPVEPGLRFAPLALRVPAAAARDSRTLLDECFGPVVLLVTYGSADELLETVGVLDGQLTATIHAGPGEHDLVATLTESLRERVGRLLFGGVPTGVAVTHAMQHGGPYPATTAPGHTSVGMTAVGRFLRPIALQNAPADVLPPALRDRNELGIWRRVDGRLTRDDVARG
jgi:NADP-dependent aldehyde dehydrogenase